MEVFKVMSTVNQATFRECMLHALTFHMEEIEVISQSGEELSSYLELSSYPSPAIRTWLYCGTKTKHLELSWRELMMYKTHFLAVLRM